MAYNEEKSLEFIEEVTRNAKAVQQNVLAEILSENGNTEYLRPFNLMDETSSHPKTSIFKSKVPMVTYEDIQPLIRRIADGDRSPILTANPVSFFNLSTGTSGGERKLIPFTEKDLDRVLFTLSLYRPIWKRHFKEVENGKGLCFWFIKDIIKTKGGLSARMLSSSCFKRAASMPNLQTIYTSPKEAILCQDPFQSMYTQMLSGLYQRQQVVWLAATFANGFVAAINFLHLNWHELTHDIRTGTLNPKLTDPSIREFCINGPDPVLADFIAQECGKDDWEGIITRIWPNAKFLNSIVTGTMSQYIPTLDYYSGGLPKVSMGYASSECYGGINLNPMSAPSEIAYTVMPNMAYYEFLPYGVGVDSSEEQLVDLVDVQVGKEYQMVVTTYAGLYRHKMSDILRVVGFHNSAPNFEFIRRENVVLSIDLDKTDEVQLQAAVDNAGRLLKTTSVVEYTSCADIKSFPGHYVIYWELGIKDGAELPSDEMLEQCCVAMEESLDEQYRTSRVIYKSIGALEIRVVKKGTFEEVMEHAISKGSSIAQYKVPRCVKDKAILDLLDSRLVSNHFSPSLPNLTPKSVSKH